MIMDVSIIIVNYNTKRLTCQCIDSIIEKTEGVSFEIIVVDNNSTDGSQELLSHDNRIVFIEAGENLGFGKANNLGFKKSTGKYLFFLNSDTILLNNALLYFFDFYESFKGRIGGVGCLLENDKGFHIHSYADFPCLKSVLCGFCVAFLSKISNKRTKVDIDKAVKTNEYFFVDYVTGADLFVDRKIVEQYGAFDPDFFMYYEETEMQKRWNKNGYKSVIIREPRIIHLEGCSVGKQKESLNERKFFMNLKSQRMYFKKTRSFIGYLGYRFISLLYLVPILRGKYTISQIIKILQIVF